MMKNNKRSTNNISETKKLKRELALLNDLNKVNPYAAYNGGFSDYEDPADYINLKLKGIKIC